MNSINIAQAITSIDEGILKTISSINMNTFKAIKGLGFEEFEEVENLKEILEEYKNNIQSLNDTESRSPTDIEASIEKLDAHKIEKEKELQERLQHTDSLEEQDSLWSEYNNEMDSLNENPEHWRDKCEENEEDINNIITSAIEKYEQKSV